MELWYFLVLVQVPKKKTFRRAKKFFVYLRDILEGVVVAEHVPSCSFEGEAAGQLL